MLNAEEDLMYNLHSIRPTLTLLIALFGSADLATGTFQDVVLGVISESADLTRDE
jgi:hypothetical protein